MREIDDIHVPAIQWLIEARVPYVYHRPDRRSGIHKGHPDFTILWMRKQIMIECKTPSGKLSDDQVKRIDFLRRAGNVVEIARNLSEFKEAAYKVLLEGKPATGVHNAYKYPLGGSFEELKRAVAAVPGNGKENLSGREGGLQPPAQTSQPATAQNNLNKVNVRRRVRNAVPVLAEPEPQSDTGRSPTTGEARESNEVLDKGGRLTSCHSRGGVPNFYIGDWKGTQYVFAPDLAGNYKMIRKASAIDIDNLPELP
jgi:hypothetical protein